MIRCTAALAGAIGCLLLPAAVFAQDIRDIRVTGARELGTDEVIAAARVRRGEPLPEPADNLDDLAARVVRRYRDEGFTFAKVQPTFDAATGVLTLAIDEGVIDRVEFTGVD